MGTGTLGVQGELRQNRVKLSVYRLLTQSPSPIGVNELALAAIGGYRSSATLLLFLTRWNTLNVVSALITRLGHASPTAWLLKASDSWKSTIGTLVVAMWCEKY